MNDFETQRRNFENMSIELTGLTKVVRACLEPSATTETVNYIEDLEELDPLEFEFDEESLNNFLQRMFSGYYLIIERLDEKASFIDQSILQFQGRIRKSDPIDSYHLREEFLKTIDMLREINELLEENA